MSRARYKFYVVLLIVGVSLVSPLLAWGEDQDNSKEPIEIAVALSGGGLRAAAFTYGVMLGLNEHFQVDEKNGKLHDKKRRKNKQIGKKEDTSECKNEDFSFLKEIDYLSSVSGGSIPAGYFYAHGASKFCSEFWRVLRDSNLKLNLVTTGQEDSTLMDYVRPPVLLVTSLFDTIFRVILFPLKLFDFEIELTPLAFVGLSDGVLKGEKLASVYESLYFGEETLGKTRFTEERDLSTDTHSKTILFGSESKNSNYDSDRQKPILLINATDITNGRVFTFDQTTFECVGASEDWKKMKIAVAAAASSNLPGVFSPIKLKNYLSEINPESVPPGCPAILYDQQRRPILVDGGVSDNLGVIGLLRNIFEKKNGEFQKKKHKKKKVFLIVVNAAVNTNSTLPNLAKVLDDSFDSLIRDKSDLSRVLAQEILPNFGFEVVELRLSDIVKGSPAARRIVMQDLKASSTVNGNHRKTLENVARSFDFTEMEQRVLEDLNATGMLPKAKEIDTLIAAGRAIVADKFITIKEKYKAFEEKQYISNCHRVLNPEREYCWPEAFETPHLVANKVGVFLDQATRTAKQFTTHLTQSKAGFIRAMKESDLRLDQMDELVNIVQKLRSDGSEHQYTQTFINQIKNEQFVDCLQLKSSTGSPIDCSVKKDLNDENLLTKKVKGNQEIKNFLASQEITGNIDNIQQHLRHINLPKIPQRSAYNDTLREPCWLKGEKNHVFEQICNFLRTLDRKLANKASHKNSSLSQSPWYYILRGSWNAAMGNWETGFFSFEEGLYKFPKDWRLLLESGYYRIIKNRDFRTAIADLQRGLHSIEQEYQKFIGLKHYIEFSPGERANLQSVFHRLEWDKKYLKFLISHFTALAPVSIQGKFERISDAQVDAWVNDNIIGPGNIVIHQSLQEILESLEEEGKGDDESRLRQTRDKIDELRKEFSNSTIHPIIPDTRLTNSIECLEEQSEEILKKFYNKKSKMSKALSRREQCSLPKIPDDINKAISQLHHSTSKLRHIVQTIIAESSGVKQALEYARSIYQSNQITAAADKFMYPFVVSDNYGLVLLTANAEKPCTQRGEAIRKAYHLFLEAEQDASSLKEKQDGTDQKAEEIWAELWLPRIQQHKKAAKRLLCPRAYTAIR